MPNQGFHYCNPGKVNQLWVDKSCFIKAGHHGTKQFDAARLVSGGDYVELTDYLSKAGLFDALAYNPQGGLAVVETTLNDVVQDTLTIDVIRFSIRDWTLVKKNQEANLTVYLHSPTHSSPDIYDKHGVDYARSWVQLSLPQGLRGNTHDGNNPYGQWVRNPIQVVNQNAQSVTFRLLVESGGNYNITVNAYRPAPDNDCTETSELRCFTPPNPQTQVQYETTVTAQATFAAPLRPPRPPT